MPSHAPFSMSTHSASGAGAGHDRLDLIFTQIHQPLDEYCERHGPGFWAEPVNAITNFCIVLAGLLILRLYQRDIVRRHGRHYPIFLALIVLVVLLGLGSFAWHTFANVWSLWLDLLPIIGLIYVYQWAVLRMVFRWNQREAIAYLALFSAATATLIGVFGDQALNGSIIYVTAVSALIWFGIRMRRLNKQGWQWMLAGVVTFLLAIFLRTFDMAVCGWMPIGTHFFWHVFNSLLVIMLAKALMLGYVGKRRTHAKHVPEAHLTM